MLQKIFLEKMTHAINTAAPALAPHFGTVGSPS